MSILCSCYIVSFIEMQPEL